MAFKLTNADENILAFINITIDGDGKTDPITLSQGEANLQFPPVILKDSKSADWMEIPSGSFEPFKYYVQSKSRQISLQFQWVTGGQFPPDVVHKITSRIKAYFYGAYFGGKKNRYPIVKILNFYELIDDDTAWRMMNVDIKRSKEMVNIIKAGSSKWYPLHTTLTMNLESATQLVDPEDSKGTPIFDFPNLPLKPTLEWY